MKTLSIMQPWAWLIVNGHKDIENRTWKNTNQGLRFRGRCLVHAGKKIDGGKRYYPDFQRYIKTSFGVDIPAIDDLQLGGIVGVMNVIDCVTQHNSPWFFGKYGFVIDAAKPLTFMPCNGQLGFFDAQYDTQEVNQCSNF